VRRTPQALLPRRLVNSPRRPKRGDNTPSRSRRAARARAEAPLTVPGRASARRRSACGTQARLAPRIACRQGRILTDTVFAQDGRDKPLLACCECVHVNCLSTVPIRAKKDAHLFFTCFLNGLLSTISVRSHYISAGQPTLAVSKRVPTTTDGQVFAQSREPFMLRRFRTVACYSHRSVAAPLASDVFQRPNCAEDPRVARRPVRGGPRQRHNLLREVDVRPGLHGSCRRPRRWRSSWPPSRRSHCGSARPVSLSTRRWKRCSGDR
jgi:hypothetical protein